MEQLVTDSDLAYARREALELLGDLCDIERKAVTPDAQGGYSEAWVMAYSDVPCRMAERTGRERFLGEQQLQDSRWVLTLDHAQDIGAADRIIHAGKTYEVTFVNSQQDYAISRRCALRRLE